jgi:hypothetical protein
MSRREAGLRERPTTTRGPARWRAASAGRSRGPWSPHRLRAPPLAPAVAKALATAINNADSLLTTPADSPSNGTWRSFTSTLHGVAMAAAAKWDCKAMDPTVPANWLAVGAGGWRRLELV